eukprot:6971135-Prymnesium_polylepis.2
MGLAVRPACDISRPQKGTKCAAQSTNIHARGECTAGRGRVRVQRCMSCVFEGAHGQCALKAALGVVANDRAHFTTLIRATHTHTHTHTHDRVPGWASPQEPRRGKDMDT